MVMAKIENPFEIKTVRSNVTFVIDGCMSRREEEDDKPKEVFDDTYSRFVLKILDKTSAFMNVPVDEVEGIRQRTKFAANKFYEQQLRSSGTGPAGTSPAFTTEFKVGHLAHKTPVQVLLENPGEKGKQLLNEQFQFLKSNLSKFPKNKELMDAILDASKVDLSGIDAGSVKPASFTFPILDIGCRPLTRRTRSDGLPLCYEGKVELDSANKYPITVQIKNYYAPVVKKDDGMLNVQLSKKDKASEKNLTCHLTLEAWQDAVWWMNKEKSNFLSMNYESAHRMAENAARENRAAHTA